MGKYITQHTNTPEKTSDEMNEKNKTLQKRHLHTLNVYFKYIVKFVT